MDRAARHGCARGPADRWPRRLPRRDAGGPPRYTAAVSREVDLPPATRLAALQGLAFASLGAVFPYLALDLRARGVDGAWLVLALLAAPILRLALGPVWGLASDRLGDGRRVVLVAAGLALAGLTALAPPLGVVVAVVAVYLIAAGNSGLTPAIDAATLRAVDHDAGRYARVRSWGSVGYLAAVFGVGAARDAWGLPPVAAGLLAATGVVAVAVGLPSSPPPAARPPGALALWRAARSPSTLLLLTAAALHFSAIAMYDGFFAIHLDALGHGTTWVGAAVALGVGVEVAVFAGAGPLLRRFGAPSLLVAAMALNIPRWLLTATIVDPLPLVAIQAVHGFTFGAFWVAAVAMLSRDVPRSLTGGGQGLLAAAVGGIGAGVGNLIGGVLVQRADPAWLFWIGAALASAATATAAASLLARRGRRAAA